MLSGAHTTYYGSYARCDGLQMTALSNGKMPLIARVMSCLPTVPEPPAGGG